MTKLGRSSDAGAILRLSTLYENRNVLVNSLSRVLLKSNSRVSNVEPSIKSVNSIIEEEEDEQEEESKDEKGLDDFSFN